MRAGVSDSGSSGRANGSLYGAWYLGTVKSERFS
jgi:hypothetical protein